MKLYKLESPVEVLGLGVYELEGEASGGPFAAPRDESKLHLKPYIPPKPTSHGNAPEHPNPKP